MAYVVIATWRAKEGEVDAVRDILRQVSRLSSAEPGCRMFVVQQSLDDPRTFVLYEQYDDEAAFKAHGATEHFKEHVLGNAVARLEKRERAFLETLD